MAKLVSLPEYIRRERETWSKAEVRKFLAKASSDRLYAAWRLSLYGLRRGEVLGLRWSDVDLRASTLTVNQARVLGSTGSASKSPSLVTASAPCPSTASWSPRWQHCASASWTRARPRVRCTGRDWPGWTGIRAAST